MLKDVSPALAHLAEVSAGIRHAQDYKEWQKLSAVGDQLLANSAGAVISYLRSFSTES
jgi:hypothetical protein